MLSEYQITLPPQTLENAQPQARAILEQAKAQVGFVPNMYTGMAHSPGLLATYLSGYAAFRNDSGFTPAEQEVVFLTISRINGCEYCVSAHSMLAEAKSKVPPAVIAALRDDQPVPDPKLAALAEFTRVMVTARGLPTRAQVEAFLAAGYSEPQILEVVLAIAVKTLSNYANHLFHTPLDGVFETHRWSDAA